MEPWLGTGFGNPSNILHEYGSEARKGVNWARQQVAALINAEPDEIIFTSGATESNNLVVRGVPPALDNPGLLISILEHESIAKPAAYLRNSGSPVHYAAADEHGRVQPEQVEEIVSEYPVGVVSIIHVQGEIGTINPIRELAEIARTHQCLVHTDAAQSVGKIPVDVHQLGVDYLTIAAHKMYGPKGIGALFVRKGGPLQPILYGAGHERGMRPGTENVPYLIGFGEACRIAGEDLTQERSRQEQLRDALFQQLSQNIPEIRLNGHPDLRHPGNLHISLPNVNSLDVLKKLPGYALSVGSACHSENPMDNPLIQALGIPENYARGAIRIGIGRSNSAEQLSRFASDLTAAYKRTLNE
jgi:cysteine desulfurase